jgi:alpha-2-macroglobulin
MKKTSSNHFSILPSGVRGLLSWVGKLIISLLLLFSCGKKNNSFNSDFSLYKDYIKSFSSGLVSSNQDIRVVLNFSKKEWTPKTNLDQDLFEISPSVEGKVVVISNNTVAFIPEKKLENGVTYQVTFNLDKIIKTPKKLETFNFTVQTIKQDFIVNTLDLQSYNSEWQYLNGIIKFADHVNYQDAIKILEASQKGNDKLNIKFNKDISSSTEIKFIIDSIQRNADDSEVEISWDGSVIDVDQKDKTKFEISGKNTFKVVSIEVPEDENQTMLINFTNPVKKGQEFNGLVAVEGANNLKFSTIGNVLKVFFQEPLSGNLLVEVFQGIESNDGFKLKQTHTEKVQFSEKNPEVKFIKSGTIMPSSNNLKINFQAVNLKAVDVKVYKIFQNNVLQFLQENELNGNNQLRKVASPIAKQKLVLKQNNILNYSRWNTFAIDISKLITPEPGAIYHVEISFKKQYALLKCTNNEPAIEEEETDPYEVTTIDGYNYYDDYYYEDYNWQEREDPCTNSFYYNKVITTNVLATDLGVIAKRGANNQYTIAVSDIISTNAVSGATVDLYSFQQQKLISGTTDGDGVVNLQTDKYAYFAIVTSNNQYTYIKLDEGKSLSVSNFDVSGETIQKGIKGFIYGERGVWRPSDTLFLSFIMNDNASKLEKNHPIKFKLSDPNGKAMYQIVQKYNEMNHYKFTVPTRAEYPTGNWEALVSVGGAKFYKSIKIETIKPNRLKIKTKFNGNLLYAQSQNPVSVETTWLHGAIARDLKMEVSAKFSKQTTTFKGLDNYTFDDPVVNFSTEETNIFSGKTNQDGKASYNINPNLTTQAPGMLKATIFTKLFENGGDFSQDVTTVNYSPYKTYIGIKTPEPNKYGVLETRKNNIYTVVSVDENGNPKANQEVAVNVYKLDWGWWWETDNSNLSNFNYSNATTAFKRFLVKTNGSGKASVQFTNTDDEWGRYLIRATDVNGKHSTGKTVLIDWPYWSGKTREKDATNASMLVFSTDKKNYKVGDKAQISFPSSEGGRALISIENGSKVLETIWAKTIKGETKVEIPITSEMAPNVFINISLLQPHGSVLNDLPIRLYGIIPIEVIDQNTILQPQILLPNVLRPEQKTTVKVSEKNGKAMSYTLAIVDDGLLDLTRFKTPNAWNNFYKREALGVKTWDIYDDIIGAYGGKVNQIFSIGGDEDLGGSGAKKTNRFKPVVMYLGPFQLNAGSSKTHEIKIPNYVGSVRAMVVAANAKESAYGSDEKTVPVRNPLMVLASMPRKISPNEKITLPVTVFAMEDYVKNVSVSIKTNNGLRMLSPSKTALNFPKPDEKMVFFDLETADLTGMGKIEILATSGKETAKYSIELDNINPNPVTSKVTELIIKPKETGTINWEAFGVKGSNRAMLELSSFPSIDFENRLSYLIQYPHGCLEQTTSSVFPQLFLADVIDLDATQKAKTQQNINTGIMKLAGFQLPNGGFSYWQGNNQTDDWSTSYVGHFLLEAETKGYAIPVGFKQKWLGYQANIARAWRIASSNDLAQSYRLYTLALAKSPEISAMNRLKESQNLSKESKLRLALAYALVGQKNTANQLMNDAYKQNNETKNAYNYYGSEYRDLAMQLDTYSNLGNKAKAFEIAVSLSKALSSSEYMSTQTTAFSLMAMSKFAQKNGGKGLDVTYTQNGKTNGVVSIKSFSIKNIDSRSGANAIEIRNNKNNTLYVRVIQKGILPVGEELALSSNLMAQTVFKTREGKIINLDAVPQGTELVGEVTITNTTNSRVENVALTQILPSGFEIINTRFTDFGSFGNNIADYIDIRDDRANFYFTLNAQETKVFKILLNASYLGKYYLPGTQAEAMYDNKYISRTKGKWFELVK